MKRKKQEEPLPETWDEWIEQQIRVALTLSRKGGAIAPEWVVDVLSGLRAHNLKQEALLQQYATAAIRIAAAMQQKDVDTQPTPE